MRRTALLLVFLLVVASRTASASPPEATRPSSGVVTFETPQITGQRLTISPYQDPATGIVFSGVPYLGFQAEVGLVRDNATSACVPTSTSNQLLGSAPLGSDAAGLSYLPIRADFNPPLAPPCTASVLFQMGAGGQARLRLFDEQGNEVGAATGIAQPGQEPCFPGWGSAAVVTLTATSAGPVSYAVMDEIVPTYVWVIDDFAYSETRLSIALDIDPNTLNLSSHARWITAYLEPDGFQAADIDVSSLRLEGSVPAVLKSAALGDHDADGIMELMVKFDRTELDPLLVLGSNELVVTGSRVTGETFEARDTIQVINPPAGGFTASVFPNPLNPAGVLAFTTSRSGPATVRVYDARGHLIRMLLHAAPLASGAHEIPFDGRDAQGRALATGVYFYRVETAEGSTTGRVAVLK